MSNVFDIAFHKQSHPANLPWKCWYSTLAHTGSNFSLSSLFFTSVEVGLSLRLTTIDCLRCCFAEAISCLYSLMITEFGGVSWYDTTEHRFNILTIKILSSSQHFAYMDIYIYNVQLLTLCTLLRSDGHLSSGLFGAVKHFITWVLSTNLGFDLDMTPYKCMWITRLYFLLFYLKKLFFQISNKWTCWGNFHQMLLMS